MLLTNHTLTGVLLGLTIDEPAVLFPVAVASHLAQDVVPHFGPPVMTKYWFRDPYYVIIGSLDFMASFGLTVASCYARPDRVGHIVIGVIGADIPDFTYLPLVVFGRKLYKWLPWYSTMIKFLSDIQRYEKPPGLIIEAVWAFALLTLLGLIPSLT